MVFYSSQCWFHYEDHYSPYPAKEVRKVVDIYTDQKDIRIPLGKINFLGLKVFARNSNNNEIAFIWDSNGQDVILNLDLGAFPNGNPPHSDLKHVKIEIDYIIVDAEVQNQQNQQLGIDGKEGPGIKDRIRIEGSEYGTIFSEYWDKWFWPKKTATISHKDRIQPEFDIMIPKGWEISNGGIGYCYEAKWKDQSGEEKHCGDKFEIPTIKWSDGKLRYDYLLCLDNDYYNDKSKDHNIEFTYFTQLSFRFVIAFVIFPLALLFLSICIFLGNFNETFLISLLIFILTFGFVYLGYLKEGYSLPYQSRSGGFLIFSLGIISLKIGAYGYISPILNATFNLTAGF
jgi:hypothetical protein